LVDQADRFPITLHNTTNNDPNEKKDKADDKSKRTEICEFCGIYFEPSQTTLKLCNGRVRSVCFLCLEDIAKQDRGEDLTKST
jgi:hypothetical protein